MIYSLIEFLATALDAVFLVWFVPKFLQQPIRDKKWTLAVVGGFLALDLIGDRYLQVFSLFWALALFLLSVVFAVCLQPKKIFSSLFSACAYNINIMLTNSLVAVVMSVFIGGIEDVLMGVNSDARVVYLVICKFVQYLVFRLILLLFRKDQGITGYTGVLSFLFSVITAVGLGLLMGVVMPHGNSSTVSILLLCLILLLLNFGLYLMVHQVQKLLKNRYALQLMEERMKAEKSRMEETQNIWKNIRKTRHDLKHHFTVMHAQLEAGEIEACQSYMESVYKSIENFGELIRSGNPIIDHLINSKLSNLEGVQVQISGFVGDYSDIEEIDLACILGNILDNAVEAQKSVPQGKRIELLFLRSSGARTVICKNTVAGSVLKDNRALHTTKGNTDFHGLGHQIVETTVRKYDGEVDYFETDGMFGVQILLPEK